MHITPLVRTDEQFEGIKPFCLDLVRKPLSEKNSYNTLLAKYRPAPSFPQPASCTFCQMLVLSAPCVVKAECYTAKELGSQGVSGMSRTAVVAKRCQGRWSFLPSSGARRPCSAVAEGF